MPKTEPGAGPITLGSDRVDITVPIPQSPIPNPQPVTARALLDRGLDKAEKESADGLFTVTVEAWGGATITMRRLSYSQVTSAYTSTMRADGTQDNDAATRMMLRLSITDPPWTKGEIDELMDNPAQLGAAIQLSMAVNELNKTGLEAVAKARAAFRPPGA